MTQDFPEAAHGAFDALHSALPASNAGDEVLTRAEAAAYFFQ
jgi:hypothetical protein